jgi:serine phosphatase RsbU (regulator of sigma subunit)
MNIGILSAFIFFLIFFYSSVNSLLFENVNNTGLLSTIFKFVYFLLIIGFTTYVFVALRHLFFLGHSSRQQIYFNTMIVFFLLASVSARFIISDELSFISTTFIVVSIMLMVMNSLRISWIAFLTKKEKITLLFLSVVITVLFIVNANNTGNESLMSLSLSKPFNVFISLILIYGAIYFSVLFFTTLFHIPTAEIFDRKAREVSSLQYFSKLITQVLDFDELTETVTDITTKVSNADASWIIWKENDDFIPIANKNIGFVDSELINKFILQKINWDDLSETTFLVLTEFDELVKVSNLYKALAVSPLKAHGKVKGLLVAIRKDEDRFNEEDKNAIATFSDYASVAIENSGLLEESIEKERLEKELDVAREIQKKILPEKNPYYDELEISSVFIPAFEVGGDFYDFFEISNTKLGFVIADVSGKGISAAFIMAEVKGIFESLSKTIESPKEILIYANDILKHTLDNKTFVSAVYGLIDIEKGQMKLSRAGHCPVVLLRNDIAKSLKPSGIGLGISKDDHFKEHLDEVTIDLEENDAIVLYTDGITEAKNESLEDFGEKYFTEILLENRNNIVDEISKKVIQEVTMFSHNHSQYDDITLVILKWKPRQSKEGGRERQKIKKDGDKEWQNSAHQL